jgi:hypothetical protein
VKKIILTITLLSLLSCRKDATAPLVADSQTQIQTDMIPESTPDTTDYSQPERPDFILADIDGDNKQDSVIIIKDRASDKEGLRIVFASAKVDTLGIVRDVAGEGFDDISWAGIFEKAPKGNQYADNTDDEGDFRDMEKVPDSEWLTLKADGIFIHAAESCGGGMIYLEDGVYKWIQQE